MFWATVDLIGVASIFMDLETENPLLDWTTFTYGHSPMSRLDSQSFLEWTLQRILFGCRGTGTLYDNRLLRN